MSDEAVAGDDAGSDALSEEFVQRHRRGEPAGMRELVDRHTEVTDEVGPAGDEQGTILPSPTSRAALLDQLGDYRILREIGRGGMGVVYEAEQLSLGRRVALKVLPRTVKRDSTAQLRFLREARSAARLHHTNIVPVFDVGQDGEIFYYAMQFIQGPGLDLVVEELKGLRDRSLGTGGRGGRPRWGGSPPPETEVPSEADRANLDTLDLIGALPPPSRAEYSGRMARALLAGQFHRGEGHRSSGMAEAQGPPVTDGPVTIDATTDRAEPPDDLDPPGDRPSSPGSTLLPGWAQLSNSDSSGRRRPFFRSVAEIGRQAASGLAHAHGRGIVHRDIKPSNLLLDAAGIVWITDFGLAKSGDEDLTASGDILGTLRYMAPERFQGEGDARADLYALGVTLYELLTLRPTFDSPDRFRLIEQVREQEPPRPRAIDPRIPRDLETIVLKSIEKDPRRRYPSALEMGEDLRRFLDGEPIKARQVGELEKAWKWARRRPAIAGLILLAAGSMLAGTAVASAFAFRANDRAEAARLAETRSRGSEQDARTARELAIVERDNSRRLSAGLAFDRGLALAEEGQPDRGLHWMLEGLKTAPDGEGDFRLMIRRNLAGWLATIHQPLKILDQGGVETNTLPVTFSPDGLTFVTSGSRNREDEAPVSLWDSATGRRLATYPEAVVPVAFRPDGKVLVLGRNDLRHLMAIDLSTGSVLWTTPEQEGQTIGVEFLPGGTRLLVKSKKDSTAPDRGRIWDAVAARPLGEPWKGLCRVAPDGRILIVENRADGLNVASLLDPSDGSRAEIFRVPGAKIYDVNLGPDSKTLWASTFESWTYRMARTSARLWDLTTRRPIGPLLDKTSSFLFLPAGDRVLTNTGDSIVLRDPTSGRALGQPLLGIGPIKYYDRGPGGRTVVTRTDRGTTQLWKLADDAVTATAVRRAGEAVPDAVDPLRDRLARVVDPHPRLARDGQASIRWFPGPGDRAVVRVSDPSDGRPIGGPARHRFSVIRAFCLSPDGRMFATGSDPGTVIGEARLWDTATGLLRVPPMLHTNFVSAAAFGPDGRLLATGDYSGLVRLWDTATGKEVGKPLVQGSIVWSMAFSPDGKTLAVGHHYEGAGKPGVLLWDVERGIPIGELLPCQNIVSEIAFRPDGKVLAATAGSSLRLWDAERGQAIGDTLVGESWPAFHPDGKAFVTAGGDGSVRLRDASTGAFLGTLLSGPSPARRLAYRGDGRLIVAGFEDGSVRLIDPATSRQVGPARWLRSPVSDVAIRPDGRSVAAVDELGESRVWPIPEAPEADDLGELALRIEARTGHRMTTGPAVIPLDSTAWAERIDRVARLDGPPSLEDDPAWHDPMAREAEEAGNAFAATWHLDRLIAARPGDWTLFARRARVRSSTDAFEQASADYERAASLGPREAVLDWQGQCAVGAAEAGRRAESLWYFDRLVAARPDDWTLRNDRSAVHGLLGNGSEEAADLAHALELGGDATLVLSAAERLARAGRWREAAGLLARCGRRNPLEPELAQAWSLACLNAGDRAGYLEARAATIARIAEVPKMLPFLLGLASTLTLGSGDGDDSGPIARRLDPKRLPGRPGEHPLFHVVSSIAGSLSLRAGQVDEAIARLEEGIAVANDEGPSDLAFLSLAHARKGDVASARRSLDRLGEWDPAKDRATFWDVQEIDWLRREAEAVVLDRTFPADPFDR